MATFEKIRKVSPYALGAFVVVFVGFMILQDSDIQNLISGGGDQRSAVIGSVEGKKIKYIDFETKVKEAIDVQRKQSQTADAQIDENQIRRQVWAETIDKMITEEESSNAGIIVNDDLVADVMMNNPPESLRKPFMDSTGSFNRALYAELITKPDNIIKYMGTDPAKMTAEDKQQAISRFRKELINVQEMLHIQLHAQHLMNIINTSSSFISPLFAREKYLAENQTADIDFISFDIKSIDQSKVTVSDDEIQKYYDEHKAFYKQKESRKVKYINFPIVPSKTDSANVNKKLNLLMSSVFSTEDLAIRDSLFNTKMSDYNGELTDYTHIQDLSPNVSAYVLGMEKGNIIGPISLPEGQTFFKLDDRRSGFNEKVKVSHILFKFNGNNDNKDSLKALANDVTKKIKDGGDFSALAGQYSQDGSSKSGGDLGFLGKGETVKPFDEAAFAAKVGEVVGPIETQFGIHIIKVTDKKSEEVKFSKIVLSYKPSGNTKSTLKREAYSVKDQVEKGVSFDELCYKIKKSSLETNFFDRQRPILNSQYITNKAFEQNINTVIDPKELDGYGWVVAYIIDQRSTGIIPIQDKKEEIKNILKRHKALDMAKVQAESAHSKVKSLDMLNKVNTIDQNLVLQVGQGVKNNGVIPGSFTRENVLTSKVFNQLSNKITEPIRGENAYFIIQVNRMDGIDENRLKSELPKFIEKLSSMNKGSAFYTWLGNARTEKKIVDDRTKFFNEF